MSITYRSSTNHKYTSTRQKFIGVVLCGAITTLGVYYLILTNNIVAQGYQVSELTSKVRDLKTTTQKLQADTAERQSLNTLQESIVKDKFVAVNTIEYISETTAENGVAIK